MGVNRWFLIFPVFHYSLLYCQYFLINITEFKAYCNTYFVLWKLNVLEIFSHLIKQLFILLLVLLKNYRWDKLILCLFQIANCFIKSTYSIVLSNRGFFGSCCLIFYWGLFFRFRFVLSASSLCIIKLYKIFWED